MASRDGFVEYPLTIPQELRFLVEMYRKDMKVVSFNQAIRTLLESHPEIDKRARLVYASINNSTPEGESP